MEANILIVDDTPANLRLLCSMLDDNGYEVRPVTDGPTALSAAYAERPDMVLLDINMPDMNGYEVCAALKADEALVDIPVIFISALNEPLDKVRAFEVGGVDYISKPFHIEEVIARIDTQLSLQRLRQQLQATNEDLAYRNRQLARVNRFFQSTLDHMTDVVRRGTWQEELLEYLDQATYEFSRIS